jgi:hypothetical protein
MPKSKKPPAQIHPPEPHDPYKMRTLEQILTLFDGGDFLAEVMQGHKDLMQALLDHNEHHGHKGCTATMTLQVGYTVGNAGDVGMSATVAFKNPKKPPSSAAAYINDAGELTLYSPMMKRMAQPIQDVTDYDPDTGEIIDV